MTPSISIGELQRKTSQFRSKKPFFIRDNRKKKNISLVFPYEGEENQEFLEEAEKLCKKFFDTQAEPKKRVFPIFKNAHKMDISLEEFNEIDTEIENMMVNGPIFPEE